MRVPLVFLTRLPVEPEMTAEPEPAETVRAVLVPVSYTHLTLPTKRIV